MSIADTGNLLLRAIPGEERTQLLPHFIRIAVSKGERLVQAGGRLEFAYFPEAGLSSNIATARGSARISCSSVRCPSPTTTGIVFTVIAKIRPCSSAGLRT